MRAASPPPADREGAEQLARTFLDRTGWQPGQVAAVAGQLAYTKYGWVMRWIIKRIARRGGLATDTTRDHDYTDWTQVARLRRDAGGRGAPGQRAQRARCFMKGDRAMTPLPHRYTVDLSGGPAGYARVESDAFPDIRIASPAEYGGPGDAWTPEHLLLASVNACFLFTFRAVTAASHVYFEYLELTSAGIVDRQDGDDALHRDRAQATRDDWSRHRCAEDPAAHAQG